MQDIKPERLWLEQTYGILMRFWAPKNWCFQTMVLEKTLESLLDSEETKPVNPKGSQLWIFIGRTEMLKLKLQYSGHLIRRADIGKDPDAGKDWRQEDKGGDCGWDVWMASLTLWPWVWASSWSLWWTGKPGVLQSMVFQRVRHDWVSELNWPEGGDPTMGLVCL